jgi:lysyl endopeptidase
MNLLRLLALAALFAFGADATVTAAPAKAREGRLELAPIDGARLLAEDRDVAARPGPLRYALGREVAIDAGAGEGRWQALADGRLQWELDVVAPGARSLSFGFERYRLPPGAELWLHDLRGGEALGPLDERYNHASGEFWTPLVATDAVRLVLTLPAERREFLQLALGTVQQGYRQILDRGGSKTHDTRAGACNVDVACPEGNAWREPIRSVAAITFTDPGTRHGLTCSGQFVRSTASALEPLFLTANHCGISANNAGSVVAYLNFENSTCRVRGTPANGSNGDGVLTSFVSGASLLAQSGPASFGTIVGSDFLLLRFHQLPPASANVWFSGWDRRDLAPASGVGIHHPEGDEKRISFDHQPQRITFYQSDASHPDGTHLRVGNWELGTTESASSGSGLWNPERRLVGLLSGGDAACLGTGPDDNDQPDWYGRLAHAWDAGSTANRRLRDWLDPVGSGASTLDGRALVELQVTLSSPAFTTPALAGDSIAITASASGGSGGYSYAWDTDGDGVFERSTAGNRIEVRFARRTATQVTVRVTDGAGVVGFASRALDVRGPRIEASAASAPVQVCGNNDGVIDPGEHWRLPVRLANTGDAAFTGGNALFAAHSNRTLPLPLDDLDDGRTEQAIALGGSGLLLYGVRHGQAVISTNGYVSFSPQESGRDWANECSGPFQLGARGPQLRPLHDDLVVGTSPGDGLRYRHFPACPRLPEVDAASPQGCHVFQWTGMERFDDNGRFEFQAIVYERSGQIVYQYRLADPLAGGGATIGIIDASGGTRLNVSCNAANSAPANSAVCIYPPGTAPASAPIGPDAFGHRAARSGQGSCRYEFLDIAAGTDVGAPLQLPAAVPAVGQLAPGASTVVDVPFLVERDAACGALLGIDHVASVDSRAHWFQLADVLGGRVGSSCRVVTHCGLPTIGPLPLQQRSGLYFDPARDANGLNNVLVRVDNTRTVFGGLWYTGERNHTPSWYEVNGELFAGAGETALVRYRNSAAPGGFAPVGTSAGRAWVGYTGRGLILAWAIDGLGAGAEHMARLDAPFAQPNHTSAWYHPPQSGWGLAIESLELGGGQQLEYVAGYLYDAAGAPRWIAGSRDSVAGGTYAMLGYRPQCPACPRYADVQTATSPAGTLRIDYTGSTSARLSTQLTLPVAWPGSWVRTDLPIQPIVTPSGAPGQ